MDERVRRFLDRIDAQAQQKESGTRKLLESRAQLEKERELIRLGLCEREEAEKLPAPYEEGEWRWDPEKSVYYRYRALEVTDEEYAEICRANERLSRANAEALKYRAPKKAGLFRFGASKSARGTKYLGGNRVAVVFRVCAWILFVLGLNLGILFGASSAPVMTIARDAAGELELSARTAAPGADFDLVRMLLTWIAFFALGMLFYAVSEALHLLQQIRDAKQADLSGERQDRS